MMPQPHLAHEEKTLILSKRTGLTTTGDSRTKTVSPLSPASRAGGWGNAQVRYIPEWY
jgi:hypothetical protein